MAVVFFIIGALGVGFVVILFVYAVVRVTPTDPEPKSGKVDAPPSRQTESPVGDALLGCGVLMLVIFTFLIAGFSICAMSVFHGMDRNTGPGWLMAVPVIGGAVVLAVMLYGIAFFRRR